MARTVRGCPMWRWDAEAAEALPVAEADDRAPRGWIGGNPRHADRRAAVAREARREVAAWLAA